jgi:hypothetical protein
MVMVEFALPFAGTVTEVGFKVTELFDGRPVT